MSAVATNTSPQASVGYEVVNALGRLNSDRPKLGEACTEQVPVARAVRYLLHALDLHQQATGHSCAKIARDIRKGRIEMRLDGDRIVIVTPGT
jgi:hypothetical protein